MADGVRQPDLQGVLQRHHVHYEVHPYDVVVERRPAHAAAVDQRVRAGFDVDLFGTVDKMQFPRFHTDEGHAIVHYLKTFVEEIQAKVGHECTIEVIPYADSLVLDTQEHLQPEAMVRIRISHSRGLDQSEGPAEEQALQAIRERLQELGIRPKGGDSVDAQ
jgi:hypothetical protein